MQFYDQEICFKKRFPILCIPLWILDLSLHRRNDPSLFLIFLLIIYIQTLYDLKINEHSSRTPQFNMLSKLLTSNINSKYEITLIKFTCLNKGRTTRNLLKHMDQINNFSCSNY